MLDRSEVDAVLSGRFAPGLNEVIKRARELIRTSSVYSISEEQELLASSKLEKLLKLRKKIANERGMSNILGRDETIAELKDLDEVITVLFFQTREYTLAIYRTKTSRSVVGCQIYFNNSH